MVTAGPLLAVVLIALAGGAALLVRLGRLGLGREVLVAAARAAAQLAVVSLLIAAVLRSAGWTVAFIVMMVLVAAGTAAGRIGGRRPGAAEAAWAVPAIVAGVGPVLALVLGTGVVPRRTVAVLPVAGILIGGAMTAAALAGRRAVEELRTRRGEYEAALALGLMPRDAALEVCRPAAALAMLPLLDQTRTVGLVTLPGAFVGVILGGASPVEAGATQLLVLIGLLAVQASAVLVTVELVAGGRLGDRA